MSKFLKLEERPSPALVISLLALFVALGSGAYAANKIGTNQIKNKAVTTGKLRGKAVTTGKLAGKAVTTGKLAGQAVGANKLKDSAVGESKLGQSAVGTDKIADGAVTNSKLDDTSVGTGKPAGWVGWHRQDRRRRGDQCEGVFRHPVPPHAPVHIRPWRQLSSAVGIRGR